jgi:thiol-disulfide isomerase/thioredoxin
VQNKKPIHYYLGLAAFLLLFCKISYAEGLPPLTHSLTPVKAAVKAHELRFQNLDEETIDIKDLKGKVVVVNFWATWCPPCRREMGSLEKLYQATKDKNVEILAVNIGEDIDTVFSFLGTVEPSPNFQMLFDYEAESLDSWGVRGLPTTYIVKPDGTIAYKATGGREFDHPDILQKVIELGLR